MRVLLAAVALAMFTTLGHGQSAEPVAPSAAAAEASVHAYGDHDKTCRAWTDQCRSCARGQGDQVICSNIGIACQPAEITCTERQPEPAK